MGWTMEKEVGQNERERVDRMKERLFIQKMKERNRIEEFIHTVLKSSSIGGVEVQPTPVGTRIIIHTSNPGLVIGSGGEKIKQLSRDIETKFKIENPQIDVQKISNPDLNPVVVAHLLAAAIENGVNFKRLGNQQLERIMRAGAIGCEIVFSGKFSGQRARTERFYAGYLKKCGEPSERDVLKGYTVANPRMGNVGVHVKIMLVNPSQLIEGERENIESEKKKEILASEEVQ